MTLAKGLAIVVAAVAVIGVGLWGWVVFGGPESSAPSVFESVPEPGPATTSRVGITVFFGAGNGQGLAGTRAEVPLAPTTTGQGEAIVRAALADPPAGYLRVIPRGTRLRAFYLDGRGTAYVDLTSDVSRLHPGGSFGEALTVGALVHAVLTNLSAVTRVRLVIEGREVDTLAGHIDIAGPLVADPSLVVSR